MFRTVQDQLGGRARKEVQLLMAISLLFIVYLLAACGNKTDTKNGVEAGLEYCNCLRENEILGKTIAVRHCQDSIAAKYPLFGMYLNTRGANNQTKSASQIIEMQNFVAKFGHAVDSCAPPFWFKE